LKAKRKQNIVIVNNKPEANLRMKQFYENNLEWVRSEKKFLAISKNFELKNVFKRMY